MLRKARQAFIFLGVCLGGALPAAADLICTPSNHPFARGYCQVVRGRHGQWVRGSAVLEENALTIKLGLETDSTFFGIAGWVQVTVRDKAGKPLGSYKSDTCAIAGKSKGHARIADFTTQKANLPANVVKNAAFLDVTPNVMQDNLPRPIGIRDWTVAVPIFNIKL
jgi:hypothetical protein